MKYILSISKKYAEKIRISLMSAKNCRHFTWRSIHIPFMMASRSVLLRMKNVAGKSCGGNQNALLYSVTLFSKIAPFSEIMWKHNVTPDRQQMKIWRMRIACWMQTHAICNNNCFSTATMVASMLLNVEVQQISWPVRFHFLCISHELLTIQTVHPKLL